MGKIWLYLKNSTYPIMGKFWLYLENSTYHGKKFGCTLRTRPIMGKFWLSSTKMTSFRFHSSSSTFSGSSFGADLFCRRTTDDGPDVTAVAAAAAAAKGNALRHFASF
jgi:hypothetical protein